MDFFTNLATGFSTALSLTNIAYCFVGVFLGTAIGVLPGLGVPATVAMLLPATFALPPVSALIMLAGIFYGAQYGGSTTSILVNLPGETSSVITASTAIRWRARARPGRALATAAIASFFAGTVCTLLIAMFAPPLGAMALKFGPAEYFSLMVLGLVASIVLASGSILHALGMVVVGLLLGLVGTDVNSGAQRYAMGIAELTDGINFVVIAMGMFGLGEIAINLEHGGHARADGQESDRPVADSRGLAAYPRARFCAARCSARCWGFSPAAERLWPRSVHMRWRRR